VDGLLRAASEDTRLNCRDLRRARQKAGHDARIHFSAAC
jgi:hypothetical protein